MIESGYDTFLSRKKKITPVKLKSTVSKRDSKKISKGRKPIDKKKTASPTKRKAGEKRKASPSSKDLDGLNFDHVHHLFCSFRSSIRKVEPGGEAAGCAKRL